MCQALVIGLAAGDYNLAGCYERALSRGLFKAHLQLGYLATYKLNYPSAVEHYMAITSAHYKGLLENAGRAWRISPATSLASVLNLRFLN